jgi:hypothetical protein
MGFMWLRIWAVDELLVNVVMGSCVPSIQGTL